MKPIGPEIKVRIPADLLADIDAAAASQGASRAHAIREAIADGLAAQPVYRVHLARIAALEEEAETYRHQLAAQDNQ